ncbi:MAG: hypothetical protein A2Y79_05730 [Deltaproteobacteria bacterium RBG_13_43_22]|nr:MAG: hypothetical protein A2Y79_05730 [Deltaproteobacteria bacterium RBG_13_43_22]
MPGNPETRRYFLGNPSPLETILKLPAPRLQRAHRQALGLEFVEKAQSSRCSPDLAGREMRSQSMFKYAVEAFVNQALSAILFFLRS